MHIEAINGWFRYVITKITIIKVTMYFYQILIEDFIREQTLARRNERNSEKVEYYKNPDLDKNGNVVPLSTVSPMDTANISLFRVVAFRKLDALVNELKTSRNRDDRLIAKFITKEREYSNAVELRELSELTKNTLGHNTVGGEYTLHEVGKVLGVSRERARQIEDSATKKLRHPATSRRVKLSYNKNN